MKTELRARLRALWICALVMGLAGATAAADTGVGVGEPRAAGEDWREQYAYTLGTQAYIFGFPYVYLPSLRWNWVTQPKGAGELPLYAPINHFSHVKTLADASYRGGGSPNNDTLYSTAWLDVGKEPVILSHPDMGERYFAFELAGVDSDNFAYVGKRTTGSKAGSFAIVGPGWKGSLPPGVKALPPSLTPTVLLFARTLIDGPEDVKAVNALQDQYTLVPLSLWGRKDAALPASRDAWKPFDAKADPLAEWRTMNRAMTENPPEARLAKLVELFAKVGVGPGQDIDRMDPATRRGLARAAVDGRQLIKAAIDSGALGRQVNNWNIPPRTLGRSGLADDFLLRASIQAMGGIISNELEEAVYFNTTKDAAGQAFDSARNYTLRFAPGQLPKVDAFWSITMYDPTFNFTPNELNRYALGDRSKGLARDADGGLTIHIQRNSPGLGKESNWLPAPQSGPFFLIMRTYMPGTDIVEQRWAPPPVTAAGATSQLGAGPDVGKEKVASITEPAGGKPAAGAKPSTTDLDYQVTYQRAFEAVIWSMPAVGIYGFHRAARDLGAKDNTVLAWSQPARPNAELLTANNVSPYTLAHTDLRKGPVVVDVPAASDKASLYGQIVDHWQITIADVGPSGLDQGKGGKFLLTPPGFKGVVPAGHIEVKSPSYRVGFSIRSVKGPNASTEDASAYARTLKMYYLDDPRPTEYIDPTDMRVSTLPFYDERYFQDLHAIVSVEEANPRDKVMTGMLASLGIEKGKPFNPDPKTTRAMRQAAVDAYFYLMHRFLHPADESKVWWKGQHWFDGLFADANREFRFETVERIDIDHRADRYFPSTYFPRKVPRLPATQYLFALADKDGKELQADRNYRLVMPAKVPASQFWSLIVYDLETFAFIYSPQQRPGLSSFDLPAMKQNGDGSTTLYFGPKAPAGLESNWIPTAGKRPLPTVRIYGGTEEFWNKSWVMPDVEQVP